MFSLKYVITYDLFTFIVTLKENTMPFYFTTTAVI
jgi:hypothetical protein